MQLPRIFLDVNMGMGFDGLRAIAKKEKTDLAEVTVLFLNRKCDTFKILIKNTYYVYYRSDAGRIPPNVLSYLPSHFDGSEIQMRSALKKLITDKLEVSRVRKQPTKVPQPARSN